MEIEDVKEYLKGNLAINYQEELPTYGEGGWKVIQLILDGEVISEDYIE